MDAFVSRKRPRSPSPEPMPNGLALDSGDIDNESTEVKLATLASLVADRDQSEPVSVDLLLDVLLAHDGSVSAAAASLRAHQQSDRRRSPKKRSSVIGPQTSMRSFVSSHSIPSTSSFTSPSTSTSSSAPSTSTSTPSAPSSTPSSRIPILYDPEDVAARTPCTLIHNFLPTAAADALLREMLSEAASFAPPKPFQLFDRTVISPHTSALFIDPADYDPLAVSDSATTAVDAYLYNGVPCADVRRLAPQLVAARPAVEAAVQNAVSRLSLESSLKSSLKSSSESSSKSFLDSSESSSDSSSAPPSTRPSPLQNWRANAAFVNCYRGNRESVGWHSDRLTYLGPHAVIGSLSLGVAREFRVRRADSDGPEQAWSIHLPHNSLLVMHPDMQEQWKHCVPPAAAASGVDRHPIAGNARINITYRHYRPEFHPRNTPRCKCRIAAVLRVVQKKQANRGRYFWMCYAGNTPGKKSCDYFQWAEFDADGKPVFSTG